MHPTETSLIPARGREDPMRALAERHIAADDFAALAWRFTLRGEIVEEGVAGHADHARSRVLARDAIYRLYSMTKPVVSVAVLQLIERGLASLEDPVARWLPDFGAARVLGVDGGLAPLARPLTLEDLLTHRAGLSYDFLPDCPVAARYREARFAEDGSRPLAALVAELAALPLAEQPGTRFRYSYATDVLAHLLERVHDRPLRDILRESLFAPLGQRDTDIEEAPEARSRLVDMHGLRTLGEVAPEVEPAQELRPMDVSASYPADAPERFARGGIGLFSTLDDYARFVEVLMHGRSSEGETLLSAPMLDLLWHDRLSAAQRPVAIGRKLMPGYGWGLVGRVMTEPGRAQYLSVAGEGGWAGAASTWFWVDRANATSGLVLTQFLGSSVPIGPLMQAAALGGLTRGGAAG